MNQLNSIMIEGNLVRDTVIKPARNGTAICKMSIASNRYFKSGENFEKEVSFFDVDAFGKTAEICHEKGKTGVMVRIFGRLKQNRWEKEGKSLSSVVIVADHVEFCVKTKSNETSARNGHDEDIQF